MNKPIEKIDSSDLPDISHIVPSEVVKHRNVINFITEVRNSHSEMSNIFSSGSCLNFYMILRRVFPESKPYFNVDHIITKIGKKYYDINGVVLGLDGYLPYHDYYNKKGMSRSIKQMYNAEYSIKNQKYEN